MAMAKSSLLLLLVSAMAAAQAQPEPGASGPEEETPPGAGIKVSTRPSVITVVGIFTLILSLAIFLLMYSKFCLPTPTPLLPATNPSPARTAAEGTDDGSAGVGKTVVESLPSFRFAALRGARQGLECAVCLARFDDADLLRLLPRCHHAFHLDCVDRWLSSSASCPLCRARVHPDDADPGLKYAAASACLVFGAGEGDDPADATAAAAVSSSGSGRDLLAGIFVERMSSSRFGAGDATDSKLDRHRHRILVSDAVFKSRWSDLNSADLIALDTEMLRSVSSGRFPYPYPYPSPDDDIIFVGDQEEAEERPPKRDRDDHGAGMAIEKKGLLEMESGSKAASSVSVRGGVCGGSEAVEPSVHLGSSRLVSSGVRSMSEIVRLPRVVARSEEEERARRRWVPIAQQTARWFATRAREEDTTGHVNASDRLRV